jgi:hypothetical protein
MRAAIAATFARISVALAASAGMVWALAGLVTSNAATSINIDDRRMVTGFSPFYEGPIVGQLSDRYNLSDGRSVPDC